MFSSLFELSSSFLPFSFKLRKSARSSANRFKPVNIDSFPLLQALIASLKDCVVKHPDLWSNELSFLDSVNSEQQFAPFTQKRQLSAFGSPLNDRGQSMLASLISGLIESIICKESAITSFNATRIEVFKSLNQFLNRTYRYIVGTLEQHLTALYMVDVLLSKNPELRLTKLNVQRVFITSTAIAQKFTDEDHFYRNERYAKIAGIPLKEMNEIERVFLNSTDFNLFVDQERLQLYILSMRFLLKHRASLNNNNCEDSFCFSSVTPSLWKTPLPFEFNQSSTQALQLTQGSPPNDEISCQESTPLLSSGNLELHSQKRSKIFCSSSHFMDCDNADKVNTPELPKTSSFFGPSNSSIKLSLDSFNFSSVSLNSHADDNIIAEHVGIAKHNKRKRDNL